MTRKNGAVGGRVLVATAVWLVLAILAGASGLLAALRPPLPQVLILILTATLMLFFLGPSPLRSWARRVDIRAFVLMHGSRFVGIYFLVLHKRGQLPYAFAVPGGWGDILVAVTAVAVAVLADPARPSGRAALLAWNVLGLADILFVVATAGRLGSADPASMSALLRLPLSLLPTFLVPIIIATHILMLVRLLARGGDAQLP